MCMCMCRHAQGSAAVMMVQHAVHAQHTHIHMNNFFPCPLHTAWNASLAKSVTGRTHTERNVSLKRGVLCYARAKGHQGVSERKSHSSHTTRDTATSAACMSKGLINQLPGRGGSPTCVDVAWTVGFTKGGISAHQWKLPLRTPNWVWALMAMSTHIPLLREEENLLEGSPHAQKVSDSPGSAA